MENESRWIDQLRIASPCSASWDAMEGGDRARFCRLCQKNVYNLSDMSRREAEDLVRAHEGRLCVRFYRRRDGTLLTDNCPVGLRRARRWLVANIAGVSALLGSLLAFGIQHTPLSRIAACRAFVVRARTLRPAPVAYPGMLEPPPQFMPRPMLVPVITDSLSRHPMGRPQAIIGQASPGALLAPRVPELPPAPPVPVGPDR